ncbi:Fic/DOC family protein [Nocardia abscessus]|uniref:Fic/DOC family protein n=1 Tax=Nocardia abscessus TaxID=120957 RepID=UPI002458CC01|nr:Fic family protein [Nocardia abscessus]
MSDPHSGQLKRTPTGDIGQQPTIDHQQPASAPEQQGAAVANLLGVRDSAELRRREYRETSLRAIEIATGRVEPPGTGDFLEWSAIHAHLFGRIYEWAGMPRAVTMSKDGRAFLQPRHFADYIPLTTDYIRSVAWASLEREQFIEHAARALMQLNWCHPFREGNGRAMRIFFDRQITDAPWQLDYTALDPSLWNTATHLSRPADDQTPTNYQVLVPVINEITVARPHTAVSHPESSHDGYVIGAAIHDIGAVATERTAPVVETQQPGYGSSPGSKTEPDVGP